MVPAHLRSVNEIRGVALTGGPWLGTTFAALSAEGLEPNVRRWFAFAPPGPGECVEVQALGVPQGSGKSCYAARTSTVDELVTVLAMVDRTATPPQGVYVVANSVVARADDVPGWRIMERGESTTDEDIARRTVLYVDLDVQRPTGTSATDAELAVAFAAAETLYAEITTSIARAALVRAATRCRRPLR